MFLATKFRQMVCEIRRDAAEAAYQSFKSGDYSDLPGSQSMADKALQDIRAANRRLAELKKAPENTAPPTFILRA